MRVCRVLCVGVCGGVSSMRVCRGWCVGVVRLIPSSHQEGKGAQHGRKEERADSNPGLDKYEPCVYTDTHQPYPIHTFVQLHSQVYSITLSHRRHGTSRSVILIFVFYRSSIPLSISLSEKALSVPCDVSICIYRRSRYNGRFLSFFPSVMYETNQVTKYEGRCQSVSE